MARSTLYGGVPSSTTTSPASLHGPRNAYQPSSVSPIDISVKKNSLEMLQFATTPSSVHHHRPGYISSFSCPAGSIDARHGQGRSEMIPRKSPEIQLFKRPPSFPSLASKPTTPFQPTASHLGFSYHGHPNSLRRSNGPVNAGCVQLSNNCDDNVSSYPDSIENRVNSSGLRYQANIWLSNKPFDSSKDSFFS